MSPANEGWIERLEQCAIAFDAALAAGQDPGSVCLPEMTSIERAEVEGIRDCLRVLEAAWPRLPRDMDSCGFSADDTEREEPLDIERLGIYRILKVLGQGGMGVVYHAEDTQLQRRVALKTMKPGHMARQPLRERFLREARAAAALKHDHIVTIFQVGEEAGTLYLAMELLEGEPLDARLRREGTLPTADIVKISREIALGLAAAHRHGLVHRDIKPANIWLEFMPERLANDGEPALGDYRVKILDFGLARALNDDAHLTQSGLVVGTPSFMAPEQTRSEAVDQRCDLFSLGCVMYRLSTGRLPFEGRDIMTTLMAVATITPQKPCELNATIPTALSVLIMRLLAKDPNQRPASAQDVILALDNLDRSPQSVLGTDTAPDVSRNRRRQLQNGQRALRALVAAVVVIGLAVTGWMLIHRNHDERSKHGDDGGRDIAARTLDQILKDLRSERSEEKVKALDEAGTHGPTAREPLGQAVAACLMDRNTSVQEAARKALDHIDPPVSLLGSTALRAVHENERIQAIQDLKDMGVRAESAIPVLIMIAKQRQDSAPTTSHSEASQAVLALGEVGPDQDGMVELFIGFTRSADFRVRDGACSGLVKLKADRPQVIVDALTACLQDSASSVRFRAAEGLGKLGNVASTAEHQLRQVAASDPDPDVRNIANRSLAMIQRSK